jgi:hypothetical protein
MRKRLWPMLKLRSTDNGNGTPITSATKSRPTCEKYCQKQRELCLAMEDLAQQEQEVYELDPSFGSDYDRL